MENKMFYQKEISEQKKEIIAETTMNFQENENALISGSYENNSCNCIRNENCCGCIIQ